MAYTGGKLNFSVAFNPTSAFPLDARCIFDKYEDALSAASVAEAAGSANTVYYYGMQLLVVDQNGAKWYVITKNNTLEPIGSGGGTAFTTDKTLTLNPETKVLSVNTASEAEADNTLPITSAAVATQIGNIEILLKTI